jgi:hypothetical protein
VNKVIRSAAVLIAGASIMLSASPANAGTTVPGHSGSKVDADNNGSPDAGVIVVGNYDETDVFGATTCNVRVNYKGDFGNDPYLNSGVIENHFVCKGPDGNQTYNYLIVSSDDPRYTGNPEWAEFGTWEYHVLTQGGQGNEDFGGNGNLVRPYTGS